MHCIYVLVLLQEVCLNFIQLAYALNLFRLFMLISATVVVPSIDVMTWRKNVLARYLEQVYGYVSTVIEFPLEQLPANATDY